MATWHVGGVAVTYASSVGSWPGTSMATALGQITEVLGHVPFVPELPRRGASSQLVGRTWGLLRGGEAGELIAADLYAWSQACGTLPRGLAATVALCGPWTLLAAGGDVDAGELADIVDEWVDGAQAFAVAAHALSSQPVRLQADEPMLATAPAWAWQEVRRALDDVTAATAGLVDGATLHCCATPLPPAVCDLGHPVLADATTLTSLPSGWPLGLVPTTGPLDDTTVAALVSHARTLVATDRLPTLTVTPACGLGHSDDAIARLRATATIAARLGDSDGRED